MSTRTRRPWLWAAVLVGLLAGASGCRQKAQAITAAPTTRELPSDADEAPRMAALIGVEGRPSNHEILPIPEFKPVEPTPEERKVLGEQPPEPKLDALALYRRPRGIEHGVAPDAFAMLVGTSGRGGASVGRERNPARYGVSSDLGGKYADAYIYSWPSSYVGLPRPPSGEVGGGWTISVGENLPRRGAAHADQYGR